MSIRKTPLPSLTVASASLMLLWLLGLSLVVSPKIQLVMAQPASTPSSDPEIQQSVRERLERALSENPSEAHIKRAWVGTLDSIANNTLTIETREGPKLASVSAETTFVRLPKRQTIEKEDLTIGAKTVVMGTVSDSRVLTAVRVLVDERTTTPPSRESYFGTIQGTDIEAKIVNLSLATGEMLRVTLGKETQITRGEGAEFIEGETADLVEGARVVVIVETAAADDSAVLLRLHLLSAAKTPPEEPAAPTPSPS